MIKHEYYPKSLLKGMRPLNNKLWLTSFKDSYICKSNSAIKAGMKWDSIARKHHGLIIQSNLPLSTHQYLQIEEEINKIWIEQKLDIIEKWLKLRKILKTQFMDKEFGVFSNMNILYSQLLLVLEWQKMLQKSDVDKCRNISLEELKFNMSDDDDKYIKIDEYFIESMVNLMIITVECASYCFVDHFRFPKLQSLNIVHYDDEYSSEMKTKYKLFDNQFNICDILSRTLKYRILHPLSYSLMMINDSSAVAISSLMIIEKRRLLLPTVKYLLHPPPPPPKRSIADELQPENVLDLNDCQTFLSSLMKIPVVVQLFWNMKHPQNTDQFYTHMDLNTLQSNLKEGKYHSLPDFWEELNIMWNNIQSFYKSNTLEYKMSRKYQQLGSPLVHIFFEGMSAANSGRKRRSRRLRNQNENDSVFNTEWLQNMFNDNTLNIIPNTISPVFSPPATKAKLSGMTSDDNTFAEDLQQKTCICPKCGVFEGKNIRSVKTHMRYCKQTQIKQYLALNKNERLCMCGFISPLKKSIRTHILSCQVIKRYLGEREMPSIMKPNTRIKVFIDNQWHVGCIIKHLSVDDCRHEPEIEKAQKEKMMEIMAHDGFTANDITYEVIHYSHVYEIYFRNISEQPIICNLMKQNHMFIADDGRRRKYQFKTVAKLISETDQKYKKKKLKKKKIENKKNKKHKKRKHKKHKNMKKRKIDDDESDENKSLSLKQPLFKKRRVGECQFVIMDYNADVRPMRDGDGNDISTDNPFFLYLSDVTRYRHHLFTEQFHLFQESSWKWMNEATKFIEEFEI